MNRIVLLLILVIAFEACTSNKKNQTEVEKLPITSPVMMDTNYTSEYVAEIQSLQNVEIRAKVKGHLENIYVDEGSSVKAGQLLFSINKEAFQLELLRAQSKIKSIRTIRLVN
jgi:membrane fusion protein (multidrug efflux system)